MVDGESYCFKIISPPQKCKIRFTFPRSCPTVFLGGRYLLSTSLTVGSLTISEQAELVLGENLELQTRAIWVKGLRGSIVWARDGTGTVASLQPSEQYYCFCALLSHFSFTTEREKKNNTY